MKKRRLSFYQRESIPWFIMCAIPVLLVFVFNYLPMIGTIIAFKDYRYDLGILGSNWVGFKNFEFFFQSNVFARITINTLAYNFAFIIVSTASSILVALLLYEVTSRARTKLFQTILITPHFMSWVVAGSMVYAILQPQNGFLNTILNVFGIESINWYAEPNKWPAILTVTYVWKNVGIDSVIYYAALMGLDASLFEAAKIDGATRTQTTKSIIIPCILNLIVMLTILKVGNIFRADFGMFYQIPRNVSILYEKTDVVDTYIFRSMREVGDMGMSTAIGLLQSVVGFILVLVTNWASKKIDEDYGLF